MSTSFRAVALIVIFSALLEWNSIHVDGQATTDADAFFDEVQDRVKTLADFVLSNYRRRQGLWESGICKSRCSVSSCKIRQLNENNWQCLALPEGGNVLSNRSCKVSAGNYKLCSKAAFSRESYVRLPGISANLDPRKISPDHELTICSQQDLDSEFLKIYPNSTVQFDKLTWVMFGASNGVFRIYPGLEQTPSFCEQTSYDPRKRVWYKAITSVSKQVIILLDQGGSMANKVLNTDTVTLFDTTKEIVVEFLDTLSTGDTVSVYTFGSMGLVNGPLTNSDKVKIPDTNQSAVLEALAPLKAKIQGLTVTVDSAPANLTAALLNLLSNNEGFNVSSAVVKSLKVILIFTKGRLAEGSIISIPSNSSIVQALTTLSVRLFIYQWKKDQSESTDPTFTDLQSAACALNGYFDEIPRVYILNDPLSALQSFYSYVARIRHTKNSKKPLWIPTYAPRIGDIMGVSYPVFDDDFLVGVVSATILRNLGQTWESVINARKDPDIVIDIGPSLNCTASLGTADVAAPGLGNSNGGLCLVSTLAASDYETRTCCDSQCNAPTGESKLSAGTTAIIVVGVLVSIVFLISLCFWKWISNLLSRCKETMSLEFFQSCRECFKSTPRPRKYEVNGRAEPEEEPMPVFG
ncbi:hypothetical protein R1flu_026426 [Riccia fluitans]|uniref:VWFA domain-containing protein n=1 Tax=Riccia fluitans TaxID=41844 RepID=A0ABD1XFX3_9MARC